MTPDSHPIKAVFFDLDGTLVRQEIDFSALRSELGMDGEADIITHIDGLLPDERRLATAILERHESAAASKARFNDGAADALDRIASMGLKTAIVTRNSRGSVRTVCEALGIRVHAVVAREDAAPKPSPEPVLAAAAAIGAKPVEVAMVGDFAFDTESAISAGAIAVYLTNGEPPRAPARAHFEIATLAELANLIAGLADGTIALGRPATVANAAEASICGNQAAQRPGRQP